ncbi:hypothetical protein [Glutamicibacter sp. JC586]|uniref:hypothetical protein n=1 Tax=Glutamicibacter sp. JC586 TaxID=2590552 RepID=UPI00351B0A2A
MTYLDIVQLAREKGEQLPESMLEYPFGPDWDVFKISGKVFMLIAEVTDSQTSFSKLRPKMPWHFGINTNKSPLATT